MSARAGRDVGPSPRCAGWSGRRHAARGRLVQATARRPCTVYDHAMEQVPYAEVGRSPPHCLFDTSLHHFSSSLQAWQWQKWMVQNSIEELQGSDTVSRDRAILLQHPPVYTLGTGSTPEHLRFDAASSPLPLFRTERGGEVTYHGPGRQPVCLSCTSIPRKPWDERPAFTDHHVQASWSCTPSWISGTTGRTSTGTCAGLRRLSSGLLTRQVLCREAGLPKSLHVLSFKEGMPPCSRCRASEGNGSRA